MEDLGFSTDVDTPVEKRLGRSKVLRGKEWKRIPPLKAGNSSDKPFVDT
jgi:hypothetical protein